MKKYLALILAVIMSISMLSMTVSAAEVENPDSPEVQPRLYFDATANLGTEFNNILTDHNLFTAALTVKSDGNNKANVELRVLDHDGEEVFSEYKTVEPGKSVKLPPIGSDAAPYILQGRVPEGYEGNYAFVVFD